MVERIQLEGRELDSILLELVLELVDIQGILQVLVLGDNQHSLRELEQVGILDNLQERELGDNHREQVGMMGMLHRGLELVQGILLLGNLHIQLELKE